MLSTKDFEHIISWRADGTGFVIHDKKRFASSIIPKYFPGMKYGYKIFLRRLRKQGYINETTNRSKSNHRRKLTHRHVLFPQNPPPSSATTSVQRQQNLFSKGSILEILAGTNNGLPIRAELQQQLGQRKQSGNKGIVGVMGGSLRVEPKQHFGQQNQIIDDGRPTGSLSNSKQSDGFAGNCIVDLTADSGEVQESPNDNESKIDCPLPIEAKPVNGKATGNRDGDTSSDSNPSKMAQTGELHTHGFLNRDEKPEFQVSSKSMQQSTDLSRGKPNPFYHHPETQAKQRKPRIKISIPNITAPIPKSSPVKKSTKMAKLVTSLPAASSTATAGSPAASPVASSHESAPPVTPSYISSRLPGAGPKDTLKKPLNEESSDRIKSYKDLLYFAMKNRGPSAVTNACSKADKTVGAYV